MYSFPNLCLVLNVPALKCFTYVLNYSSSPLTGLGCSCLSSVIYSSKTYNVVVIKLLGIMDSSKDLIEGMKPLKYMYAHYSKKPFIDPRLRNPPMTTSKHLPIKSKLPSLTVNLANLSPILSNYTYQWGLCRTTPAQIHHSLFLACLLFLSCCFPAQLFAFNKSFLWTSNTSLAMKVSLCLQSDHLFLSEFWSMLYASFTLYIFTCSTLYYTRHPKKIS